MTTPLPSATFARRGPSSNLGNNPAVEVCFTDILRRRAVRVTGTGTVVPPSDADPALEAAYAESWARYQPYVRSYVKIDISSAELITSPAYDIGLTEAELRSTNLEKLNSL